VTQLLGFVAGTLTAFAFMPQVLKTWQSDSCADLSMTMLGAQCAGVGLWIVYGVFMRSLPVIVSNTVTLTMCLALLYFKLTRRPTSRTPEAL
jgi:MtN3 and saliva related transmembrane protein